MGVLAVVVSVRPVSRGGRERESEDSDGEEAKCGEGAAK